MYIKTLLIQLLFPSYDDANMKAAANCISAIAAKELPKGEWGDLIQTLSQKANDQESSSRFAAI